MQSEFSTYTQQTYLYLFGFINNFCNLISYEPELHPGVTYKLKELRATLKIFSTGSVTITGINNNFHKSLYILLIIYILNLHQ